jgi:hypothetical protein
MTQIYFRRSNPKEVLVDRCGAVVNDLERHAIVDPRRAILHQRTQSGGLVRLQINVAARAASGSMSVCRRATTAG